MNPEDHSDPSGHSGESEPELVVQGGMVIAAADGRDPIPNASIWVARGRIVDIRTPDSTGPPPGIRPEIIDATRCIVMPGLINAHTHAAMTLFRGLADDLPLRQWLFEKIFPAEARHLSPDTVYWGSLLGCLEMIASGTTALVDGYFFQDETVRAVKESGLRGLLAQGVIDFPAPGVGDPTQNLKVAREFVERWIGCSDLILPGMFCHSPLTCSAQTLQGAWKMSREFGLPLQIHLSETAEEVTEILQKTGKRPVAYLEDLGLLGPELIAAHAVHLSDDEMERLVETGVKVIHVPESNMKLCSGVARVRDMVRRGLTVGLGTDGSSSNNNLDLLGEMDTAAKLSKVSFLDPVGLDAKTVIRMATEWGAAVLGREEAVGTLEIGKRADMIVVDLHTPQLCPVYDPLSAIVYAASGADVKDVVVDGKILMKDREFTTLDAKEIMTRVKEIAKDISLWSCR